MKNLSLKMDEAVFLETEKITAKINKNRNRYINEAVEFYNLLQRRRILSKQLQKESKMVQEDLLNKIHPSTIVCPITTNVQPESEILRVHLNQGTAKLKEECDIMMDQIRAIDNKRLIAKLGSLPEKTITRIKENIAIIFDL